ncbi:MAG: DUF192 domain-containing protein [Acidobacteria bacterium]|nr:DUF192 domain-containing protein [Acidobacteriota bacterium]
MARDDNSVFVFNRTKQTFLAYRAKMADSVISRLVGLLGRRSLDGDGGLWIVPSSGIHTVGMLFTIDVVFLNKDLRVVALSELVRPFSVTKLSWQAQSVLELPAHTIFRSQTEVGDQLVISSDESALVSEVEDLREPQKVEPLQKVAPSR